MGRRDRIDVEEYLSSDAAAAEDLALKLESTAIASPDTPNVKSMDSAAVIVSGRPARPSVRILTFSNAAA